MANTALHSVQRGKTIKTVCLTSPALLITNANLYSVGHAPVPSIYDPDAVKRSAT